MRNLHDRATLTAALTPPPGYALHHAVGTTFTLDLETALTVPLALAARGATDASDHLGVLDALRRSADRIDIFTQVGEIRMGTPSDLVVLLEESIHQVRAPRGLFHPKVWFLQFVRDTGGSSAPSSRFRFLCATRNLTPDRSWDLLVQLEGEPLQGAEYLSPRSPQEAEALAASRLTNAPLAELLRALTELSTHRLSAHRAERIAALAAAWETVVWETPADTKSVAFHVFGIGETQRVAPVLGGRNALVISPFLSEGGLARVRSGVSGETHVLSRVESLERLDPSALGGRIRTYVLDDAATLGDEAAPEGGSPREHPRDVLSGLHAKALIYDRGQSSRVFVGSANATDAAWNENVEVMVEFEARSASHGVSAMLEGLGGFAEPYEASGGAEEPEADRVARQLEHLLRGIAAVPWTVRMTGDGPCDLAVWANSGVDHAIDRLRHEFEAELSWHLLTRRDAGAFGAPSEAHPAHITGLSLDEVTPFLMLQVKTSDGVVARTIVLARLVGDIDERRDAIIGRHVTDRASFLRLLTLMLELTGVRFGETQGGAPWAWAGQTGGAVADFSGLMEAMVRALAKQPEALGDVRRMIKFVQHSESAAEILTEDFNKLWKEVDSADLSTRRGLRADAGQAYGVSERSRAGSGGRE